MYYELLSIPAPTFSEKNRAEYIMNKLKNYDNIEAYMDEKYNVFVHSKRLGEKAALFTAHLDTVFPDEHIVIKKEGDIISAPGAGDDTANVYVLLKTIIAMAEKNCIPDNAIFVFNTCEEGLGNLLGIRNVFDRFADRISFHVTFDLSYRSIINTAVGSVRKRVCINTKGGHSYSAFGAPNAIAVASDIIAEIYKTDISDYAANTTYNIGLIKGGVSVNTIAPECEFVYETRSSDSMSMKKLNSHIEELINKQRSAEKIINVEIIGERPCEANVPADKKQALFDACYSAVKEYYAEPTIKSGSTDANMSLSMGIPGICIGCYDGKGEHTYEEYISEKSLEIGIKICQNVINKVIDLI